MPNHVRNILKIECDDERRAEILSAIQNDELGPGSIDFNKIIPMPESLDMTSGSVEDHAISAYLTAINPATPDCGKEKIPPHVFIVVAQQLNTMKRFGSHDVGMPISEMQKHAESLRFEEKFKDKSQSELFAAFIEQGQQYVHNALEYGSTTWYDWCNKNWGTKWNAYDVEVGEDGTITFNTAWATPEPVIKALSQKYPDIAVHIKWADEDLGHNVGTGEYRNGVLEDYHFPDPGSPEAHELAAELWNIDLELLGYCLSKDGSTYEYREAPDKDEAPDESPVQEQSM